MPKGYGLGSLSKGDSQRETQQLSARSTNVKSAFNQREEGVSWDFLGVRLR